jgi:hypothetical protein
LVLAELAGVAEVDELAEVVGGAGKVEIDDQVKRDECLPFRYYFIFAKASLEVVRFDSS